jgi:hypothetical protein
LGSISAKHVFHAHERPERGQKIFSRRITIVTKLLESSRPILAVLSRLEVMRGAHHMGRGELTLKLLAHGSVNSALSKSSRLGKAAKEHAVDAEAICEADSASNMRFVAMKSEYHKPNATCSGTRPFRSATNQIVNRATWFIWRNLLIAAERCGLIWATLSSPQSTKRFCA